MIPNHHGQSVVSFSSEKMDWILLAHFSKCIHPKNSEKNKCFATLCILPSTKLYNLGKCFHLFNLCHSGIFCLSNSSSVQMFPFNVGRNIAILVYLISMKRKIKMVNSTLIYKLDKTVHLCCIGHTYTIERNSGHQFQKCPCWT